MTSFTSAISSRRSGKLETLQEMQRARQDLEALAAELAAYRAGLASEQERAEFDAAWGLDPGGRFLSRDSAGSGASGRVRPEIGTVDRAKDGSTGYYCDGDGYGEGDDIEARGAERAPRPSSRAARQSSVRAIAGMRAALGLGSELPDVRSVVLAELQTLHKVKRRRLRLVLES